MSIPPKADTTATPTFTGPLRITSTGVDLDDAQPKADYFNYEIALRGDNDDEFYIPAKAAIWNDASSTPNYEQCVSVVNTQPLSSDEKSTLPYRQGLGLCLVSSKGVAFMRVTSATGTTGGVQMQTTRWDRVDQ